MKQYAALVVLSLLLAGCDAAKTNQTPAVSINGQRVNVEVAQTVAERSRGLSNRPPLGADEGMVFVFPEPSTPSFWMNGMRFPLDLIWIANQTVVNITSDVPVPTSTARFCHLAFRG